MVNRWMRCFCMFFIFLLPAEHYGQADTGIIRSNLVFLTKSQKFRRFDSLKQLTAISNGINAVFKEYSDSVNFLYYMADGREYRNVIASFGTENKRRIIIGAHYDVCGSQEGADDNASGVVAIMELARMLKSKKLKHRIDLVAYCTEEPPFFGDKTMGSAVHAKYMKENKVQLIGMISVEMIGYFDDRKGSQHYPLKILSLIYGKRGNYITMVRKFGAGKFARKFSKKFKRNAEIRTKKFVGPKSLIGIDFSDHLYYWEYGFSALMITDTSWFRNENYHKPTDTLETLDIPRMAKVIDGIYRTLMKMAG